MPIYEYEHKAGRCGVGGRANRFEKMQTFSAEPLTVCPFCGEPVHRVLSVPGRPVTGSLMSADNLAAKGFTQYKKSSDGTYERTAGQGGPTRFDPNAGS